MLRIVCLIGFSFLTLSAQAEEWHGFRGPGAQGTSTEQGLPTSWSAEENVAWKTKLPGYGASSPITLGERIYLTCYSGVQAGNRGTSVGSDLMRHVVCLNRANGKLIWQTPVEPKLPESSTVKDHGYAAATPATDGKNIYVFFGKTGVLAFDLEGKQLWQADVGSGTHKWGCGTSPVLYENLVIVNASVESGSLVAIDKTSGNEVWRARGMKSSWNTPHLVETADGKHELVVSIKGGILAYDPATGEQLWNCQGIPDYVCPSIVSQDGIVYAIGGRKSKAIAIRAGGSGDVSESHKIWEAGAGANVSSPVIHDGYLYWVSDRNKVAYCLELKTGDIVYQKRFPAQPYASALAADGKLYIVSRFSGTFVLAAKPEFEQLAHNELDDEAVFLASPVVSQGQLLLRSNEYLYCIGNAR